MSDPLASLFIWRKIRREAFCEVAIRGDLNGICNPQIDVVGNG